MTRLVRLEPPAVLPVTVAEAKAHLQILMDAQDDLIEEYIRGVVDSLDGADGSLGRCLVPQKWAFAIDANFPSVIEVPLPPLIEVTEVRYVDSAGALQVLAPANYQVSGAGGSGKAEVAPAYGENWPSTRSMREAIVVSFRCGYSDGGSPEGHAVPPAIIAAILEMVGTRFEYRQAHISGDVAFHDLPISASARAALDNYKIWSF